jgi:hypothetical protein
MIDKLLNLIKSTGAKDLYVDCNGEKLMVIDVNYNKNNNAIELLTSKGSVKWIELNGKYPIKLWKKS